ncbi:MAG TPA: HNH endonuclease [Planctomycetaceae bacterium]|nr:HNH endonuclease [Planctomycetaceae bacterium]
MQSLPESDAALPVQVLAGGFRNVTNSYKFYWFLAILEHVSKFHTPKIAINDLAAEMVVLAWYPINYFNLSFGKQDKLSDAVKSLRTETNTESNSDSERIRAAFKSLNQSSNAHKIVTERTRYVPYRFVRPWFAEETRGLPDQQINTRIQELCKRDFHSQSPPMYRFVDDSIEINTRWFEYLNKNISILRHFSFWNLVVYVQANNPNVPNVPGKLFAPSERDLKEARAFWNVAFTELRNIACPYSNLPLSVNEISLDHFLPWSFTAHDLLWNIVPTTKQINSSKGDRLPKLDRYFHPYAHLQYQALQSVIRKGKAGLAEDFVMLWKIDDAKRFLEMDLLTFSKSLRDVVSPQYEIARNMGFVADWVA